MKKLSVLLLFTVALTLLSGCVDKPSSSPETTENTVNSVVETSTHNVESTYLTTEVSTETSVSVPEKVEETAVFESIKPTKAKSSALQTKITPEQAKSIALKHAGLSAQEIKRYKSELDKERDLLVYEIEFDHDKYEYDYEIDANSGKVIKSQKEIND